MTYQETIDKAVMHALRAEDQLHRSDEAPADFATFLVQQAQVNVTLSIAWEHIARHTRT